MARRYTYATTLSWGGDTPTAEVEVEVSYEVDWGSPESGTFGPPENYDPGSESAVECIRLEKVEGKPRPWGMYLGYIVNEDDEFEQSVIEKLDDHHAQMIAEATEQEAADYDAAQDARWEERRLEARS